MTGEERELSVEHRDTSANEAVMELRAVSARSSRGLPALREVSLAVRRGEILGIAGVSGNGQSELAEVLTGLRRVDDGDVIVSGQRLTNASPRRFADAGVGNIPEDRIGTGLVRSALRSRQRRAPPLPRRRAVGVARVEAPGDRGVRSATGRQGPRPDAVARSR